MIKPVIFNSYYGVNTKFGQNDTGSATNQDSKDEYTGAFDKEETLKEKEALKEIEKNINPKDKKLYDCIRKTVLKARKKGGNVTEAVWDAINKFDENTYTKEEREKMKKAAAITLKNMAKLGAELGVVVTMTTLAANGILPLLGCNSAVCGVVSAICSAGIVSTLAGTDLLNNYSELSNVSQAEKEELAINSLKKGINPDTQSIRYQS